MDHRNHRGAGGRVRPAALALLAAAAFAASAAPAWAEGAVVNVNTATAEQLEALPGIGASRAQAIVELRKQRGGFRSLDDLTAVKGIGEATLEKLKPQMRLGGKGSPARP